MKDESFLSAILKANFGSSILLKDAHPLSGGCINETMVLNTNHGSFFVKWNHAKDLSFFEKEKHGLEALRNTKAVRVPKVLGIGVEQQVPYLIQEYISHGNPTSNYWEELGRSLAQLHQCSAQQFGFSEDNFIGALPQRNTYRDHWIDFFIDCRIEPQLTLAIENGFLDQQGCDEIRSIYPILAEVFPYERPVLTHGDLWSGNIVCGAGQEAYIIDPAVHYANREMELAFTTLFGGFDQRFYDAYNEVSPLEKGFAHRIDLYNLYPLLVHVNLFGLSYLGQLKRIVNTFA